MTSLTGSGPPLAVGARFVRARDRFRAPGRCHGPTTNTGMGASQRIRTGQRGRVLRSAGRNMRERTLRPESILMRNARYAQDISIGDAATEAGITEERWTAIETGRRRRRARADTIARMARAVGIRPETMLPLRPDAAGALEVMELRDYVGTPEYEVRLQRVIDHLPEPDRTVFRRLAAERSRPLPGK